MSVYLSGVMPYDAMSTLNMADLLHNRQTEHQPFQGFYNLMLLSTEQSFTQLKRELSNFPPFSTSDGAGNQDKRRGRKCSNGSWGQVHVQ